MRHLAVILSFLLFVGQLFATNKQDTCVTLAPMRYSINGLEGMLYHWKASGGVIASADTLNDTIFVNWQRAGDYKLSVTGELDGCFTEEKFLDVTIRKSPVFSLGPDVTLCEGENKTIEIPEEFTHVEWQNQTIGRWYSADKAEIVWAKVVNAENCSATDDLEVFVKPAPKVNLGKDTTICQDDVLTLDAGNTNSIYEWSTKHISQTIQITPDDIKSDRYGNNKNGKLEVFVTVSDLICESTDTIIVSLCDIVFDVKRIPHAITPSNKDGANDIWKIAGLSENFPNATVEIYDRWGRIIFRSAKGYAKPWEGTDFNKQIVPMDSYYYIINFNEKGKAPISGTITVIR